MSLPRTRVAIIGTGFMGRVHCEALRRLGVVDVEAVAGSHLDKARAFADAHGADRAASDYRAVIADRSIDAVHICTPNVSHFEIAASAVAAGKHVVCEKPLAMTSAEAASLVSGATAKKIRNATCYNLRVYPMLSSHRQRRWVDVEG